MSADAPRCVACRCAPRCGNVSAHAGLGYSFCRKHRIDYVTWLRAELAAMTAEVLAEA